MGLKTRNLTFRRFVSKIVGMTILLMMCSLLTAQVTVRAQNAEADRILSSAIAQSAIVEQQIAEIAKSDVIVMLSTISAASKDRAAFRGQTQLLTANANQRIVLIRLRVPDIFQIPTLAHELQHVVEIAQRSDVRTNADLVKMLREIGRDNGNGLFETDAALTVEQLVKNELKR